jgi:hypothetical protein
MSKTIPYTPDTFAILDFIEFVFRIISKAENDTYHKFPNHYHFRFDKTEGQLNFVNDVNRLFVRNGIAYELQTNGQIKRVLSDVMTHRKLHTCNDPVNNCTCYSCSKNGAYEYDERTRNQALDS